MSNIRDRFLLNALLFIGVVSVLVFALQVPAQEIPKASNPPVNKEAFLAEKLKLDEQISEAERTLDRIPEGPANAYRNARAIENIVRIKKERILWQRRSRWTAGFTQAQRQEFFDQIKADYRQSQDLLQKAISIYTSINLAKSSAVASDKIELAWFLLHPVGFSHDLDIEKNLRESEKLYLDALALQEELTGRESDLTLDTISLICSFYKDNADFEKALALYERYVESIEKRFGPTHKSLMAPLREMGRIAAMTERQKEADEIAFRVSTISARAEILRPEYPDLISRATKLPTVDLGRIRSYDRSKSGGLTGLGSIEEREAPTVIESQFAKQIIVKIVVDETGNVAEAKLTGATGKGSVILKAAQTTKFRPFVYKGVARRMLGRLVYNIIE